MKLLRPIWDDLRQGENIDLYLTVVAALAISVLNLIGLAPAVLLPAITLAVLALLAVTNLVNRHKLDDAIQKQSSAQFFVENYPSSVTDDINNAKELWLVGYSLARTVLNFGSALEAKLSRNERIKVLLIDPHSGAVRYANAGLLYPMTLEQFSQRIDTSLTMLSQIAKKYPGRLDVRLIDHPISFGTYAMNVDAPNGTMYVELYEYKTTSDEPRFVLRKKDGHWFELYREQLAILWKAAKPYEL
jgi:hypothetical protein